MRGNSIDQAAPSPKQYHDVDDSQPLRKPRLIKPFLYNHLYVLTRTSQNSLSPPSRVQPSQAPVCIKPSDTSIGKKQEKSDGSGWNDKPDGGLEILEVARVALVGQKWLSSGQDGGCALPTPA
ncbi:hypothetical protein O988_07152 [Pseudogymnoascus sp. VKM F-3808]|nr:hypothetical protein O988_07152 [Pseudogymnoascus sp. VKM F-3808]